MSTLFARMHNEKIKMIKMIGLRITGFILISINGWQKCLT
jgi:hypothetical protein